MKARRDLIASLVSEHYREHGEPPTIRELRDRAGLGSTGGVVHHLKVLESEGRVRRGRRGWMPT